MTKKRLTRSINEENFFITNAGEQIKDLKELAQNFATMHPDVFNHHVNEQRNDFATWVENIFKEKELATTLHLTHNAKDSQIAVLNHLVEKLY
ncbi:hypothetical protein JXM83_05505 [Candidatus Woesearchaeota archaeon]|nr:hypothetical protein [Candidatus Woesearchaeota archaeon]